VIAEACEGNRTVVLACVDGKVSAKAAKKFFDFAAGMLRGSRAHHGRSHFRRVRCHVKLRMRCQTENTARRGILEWCAIRAESLPDRWQVLIWLFSASGLRAPVRARELNLPRVAVAWPSRRLLFGFRDRFTKHDGTILRLQILARRVLNLFLCDGQESIENIVNKLRVAIKTK